MPSRPPEQMFGRYVVLGKTAYRGHPPGTEFEAKLDRQAERRACIRGSIRLLERFTPSVQPGSYVMPYGWLTPRDADLAFDHPERR